MSDRTQRLKKLLAQSRPKGQQLIRTLGEGPAKELFDIVLQSGLVVPQIQNTKNSDEDVLRVVDLFLDRELENVARTGRTLGSLTSGLDSGRLADSVATHAMAPGGYGAAPTDTETLEAARWVNNASNTSRGKRGPMVETNDIIAMAFAARTPMNALGGIDYINQLLLGQGGRAEARGPVITSPSPLPSSPGGRRLLEIAMQHLGTRSPGEPGCRWQDLACYLLGAVIACHGFPDANGRTGRVLYSICWLRSGTPFVGITSTGEQVLTGFPA